MTHILGCDMTDVKLAMASYVAMGGVMVLSIPTVLKHDLQGVCACVCVYTKSLSGILRTCNRFDNINSNDMSVLSHRWKGCRADSAIHIVDIFQNVSIVQNERYG
jgi:hypothetical protein